MISAEEALMRSTTVGTIPSKAVLIRFRISIDQHDFRIDATEVRFGSDLPQVRAEQGLQPMEIAR